MKNKTYLLINIHHWFFSQRIIFTWANRPPDLCSPTCSGDCFLMVIPLISLQLGKNKRTFQYKWIFLYWEHWWKSNINNNISFTSDQIRSDQSLSRVRLFATPWIAAHQASLSITNSRSSLRLTSMKPVMPSSHLILYRPLLLLPPIPPSISVFSNESTLRMRWPNLTLGTTTRISNITFDMPLSLLEEVTERTWLLVDPWSWTWEMGRAFPPLLSLENTFSFCRSYLKDASPEGVIC